MRADFASTDTSDNPRLQAHVLTVALVGNPNCGKTTLFNALTGLRQKVGNYPGVTVEKKEGRASLPNGVQARLLDLPGLYSLTPHSPDETIAKEVLTGLRADTPAPDVILNIVDAGNLERNLYLTSQILELGIPIVIALTMMDETDKQGIRLDVAALEKAIGVPVCRVVATARDGVECLLERLASATTDAAPASVWEVPDSVQDEIAELEAALKRDRGMTSRIAFAEAVSLLVQESEHAHVDYPVASIRARVHDIQTRLLEKEVDFAAQVIEARYAWITRVCRGVLQKPAIPSRPRLTKQERLDQIAMHPFWGYVLFFTLMTVLFQAIFSWMSYPMDLIDQGIGILGDGVTNLLPPGDFTDLLKEGILGGVGATIVFLPQILLLFFFISLLEDTGYMARAAFLMDRLMSKVGLHGKSFIPMLSSFACAIPGIMATRTIGDRKARLITILVAPLMSCSARLPVYALLIGAFMPHRAVVSIAGLTLLSLPGLTLLSMYLLGMIAAFGIAWLFHRTLLKGVPPTFLMELPPFRRPSLKAALIQMLERSTLFLRRAGTVILAVSVVLWALATYPRRPDLPEEQRVAYSFVGYMGRAIEPLIAPLGFDWKIGVGIVSSFAAREVFVSAMGTVYNVADADTTGDLDLRRKLREDVDPRTGKPVFTPLVAISLMVFYVLALQCMSTIAVVRRETNGWKWPLFQLAYMTGLAWVASFVVYQGGRLLGFT